MSERIKGKSDGKVKILCVGDTHFPYEKQTYLNQLYAFASQYHPTHIIQIGDLYDQYNFSRYPKEEDKLAKSELFAGRKKAEEFWRTLQQASPQARCYQLVGNHCMRMLKKVKQVAPELLPMVREYWTKVYRFQEVTTLQDDRSELVINNVLFIHGYLANLGDHLKLNRQNVVVGHSHKGGVVYIRHNTKTLFELNCGHLADDSKLPFSYPPQRTTFWTPGFGVVETLLNNTITARFIPL